MTLTLGNRRSSKWFFAFDLIWSDYGGLWVAIVVGGGAATAC